MHERAKAASLPAARIDRRAIVDALRGWQRGALDAAGLKGWLHGQGGTGAGAHLDAAAREALAAIDLLEVHLLTVEDVPALLALLDGEDAIAVARFERYRDGIDLDARSRALRKNAFYRPFCR